MSRSELVVTFVVCLGLSSMPGAHCCWASATDDPPPYEQLIKDLGSDDAAARKAAAEKLASAEAIPFLVQAVGGPDDNVARAALEVLVGLLDSDKPEVAGQAEAAVVKLEQSPNETVATPVRAMLERREETTLRALHDLRASANRGREGFMIRIDYGWKGGDEGFKQLRRLRGPLTLEIALEGEPQTIDRGWEGPSPRRRSEAEGIPPTTVQGLTSLHDLRNLESVSLTMLATHDDLVRLAALPQLKQLSLIFPDESTGSELTEVAKLIQLEQLKLFKAPNLAEQLEALAALPALKSLGVAYGASAITSGLTHVSKLVKLETLTVANVPDLGACLPELATLPGLRQLALVGKSVTDSDLIQVGKMANLEDLMLQGTAVTDDGLAHLKGLTRLRRLLLPWTTITDDAVPHLQQLSALEILNAHGSFLSAVEATKLHQYLPNLWMGELVGTRDDPFHVMPSGPRNAKTGGVGLTPAPSPEHRQAVREITRLGGIVRVSDSDSSPDAAREWRTRVVLGRSWRGGEEGLALLAKLERVDSLDINTPLSDSAADQLRHLARLQTITLRDTQMTDQGLRFLGSLPNLKTVALVGPFTDAAVPYLSHTTAERVLAKETQISDAGQQAIQQALQPNVQAAKHVEQINEIEKVKAMVGRACAELPTDPAARRQAREERNRVREELARSAMVAIPVLGDAAQHGESAQRVQALLLLHRLGSNNLSWGFGTLPNLEEVLPEVQEAFRGLATWDRDQSTAARTDEEKALIELGNYGGRVTFAPDDRMGYYVTIFPEWSGGDAGLSCLSHLKPLRHLQMSGATVSSRGLSIIGSLTDLKSLRIELDATDAPGLDVLRGLTNLESLEIGTPVNDEALRGLAGMNSIILLRLTGVSDAGLQYVGQLPQLTGLMMRDSPDFTGAGLEHLATAAQLGSLSIWRAPRFTGDGLQHLATLSSLRSLSFLETGVLGSSLASLSQLTGLEELEILSSPLSKEGIQHIGALKELKTLSIQNSTLVDDDLKHLADLPRLERLTLSGNGISDEGIAYLTKLPSLKEVRVDDTFVSADGEAKLAAALPGARRQPRGFPPNRQDKEVRAPVTAEYLAAVREVVALGASVRRTDRGCAVTLFAHWSGGDGKLALLGKLGDVQHLSIKSPIADTAIPYLKKLTNLETLGLEDAHISDAGVAELKKALPNTNIVLPDER